VQTRLLDVEGVHLQDVRHALTEPAVLQASRQVRLFGGSSLDHRLAGAQDLHQLELVVVEVHAVDLCVLVDDCFLDYRVHVSL